MGTIGRVNYIVTSVRANVCAMRNYDIYGIDSNIRIHTTKLHFCLGFWLDINQGIAQKMITYDTEKNEESNIKMFLG